MRAIGVIPARMGSTRFPGKPLAPLLGRPMLEHVFRRTACCRELDEVIVATCDREIALAARAFGARAVMTSSRHERAADRVAEVARAVRADVYVMVQGDEPMVTPAMIRRALAPLRRGEPGVACVNIAEPIRSLREFRDPNTIKVAMDRRGDALYMSREPIPTSARLPFARLRAYRQVCVMPFRRDFILRFAKLSPTPLERAESIDMLRAMEHGLKVRLVPCATRTRAVDTPADLRRVERILRRDPLARRYLDGTRP